MKRAMLILALFMALGQFLVPAGESGGKGGDLLNRQLRLDAWGRTLAETCDFLTKQTGFSISIKHLPPDVAATRVYIHSERVRLHQLLECLARIAGCRYKMDGDSSARLVLGYEWVGSGFAARIYDIDDYLAPGQTAEDLKASLGELSKIVPFLSKDLFETTLEQYPAPGGKMSSRLRVILPEQLIQYFDGALLCLTGREEKTALAERIRQTDDDSQLMAAAMQKRVSLNYRSLPLKEVLRDLSTQTGLTIVPDSAAFGNVSPPALNITMLNVPLSQALDEIGKKLGLQRPVFIPPDMILLAYGPHEEWRLDKATRKLLWDGLEVKGFDAAAAAERLGGEKALMHMLIERVYPDVWKDPACSIVFNPRYGRLAVVAPKEVQAEIAAQIAAVAAGGNPQ